MSKEPAARLGDRVLGNCTQHGSNIQGTIITAAETVKINSEGAAAKEHLVQADPPCNHVSTIIEGSEEFLIEGEPQARKGDKFGKSNEPYKGEIIEGSPDTFVGK